MRYAMSFEDFVSCSYKVYTTAEYILRILPQLYKYYEYLLNDALLIHIVFTSCILLFISFYLV